MNGHRLGKDLTVFLLKSILLSLVFRLAWLFAFGPFVGGEGASAPFSVNAVPGDVVDDQQRRSSDAQLSAVHELPMREEARRVHPAAPARRFDPMLERWERQAWPNQ